MGNEVNITSLTSGAHKTVLLYPSKQQDEDAKRYIQSLCGDRRSRFCCENSVKVTYIHPDALWTFNYTILQWNDHPTVQAENIQQTEKKGGGRGMIEFCFIDQQLHALYHENVFSWAAVITAKLTRIDL